MDVIYSSKKLYLLFWPAEAEAAAAAAEQRARVIEHRCAAATRCAMLKTYIRTEQRISKVHETEKFYSHTPICFA